ncbi:MAG TPA: histidine phosphatase family protein [Pseudonocardia sp.]|nr:histidine phosphatase family protein [Pseudonocardia sp.]
MTMNGVTMRVTLLCAAATAATSAVAFSSDEPATSAQLARVADLVPELPRINEVRRAPGLRCEQTAQALDLGHARRESALAEADFGRWAGRTLDEVLASDPEAVTAWLSDPEANPHGGETLAALVRRVGSWLDGLTEAPGTGHSLLAIADQTVIRAALAYAVGAGAHAIWRFDVAPLCRAELVGEPGRWSLRSLRQLRR